MAAPFDANRRTFTGAAVPLADQIQLSTLSLTSLTWRAGAYSVAGASALVYLRSASADSQLVWLNRSGERLGVLGDPATMAMCSCRKTASERRSASSILRERVRATSGCSTSPVASETASPSTLGTSSRASGRRTTVASPSIPPGVVGETCTGKGRGVARERRNCCWREGPRSSRKAGPPMASRSSTSRPPQIPRSKTSGSCRSPETGLHGRTSRRPYGEGVGARFSPDGNWISYTSNESGVQKAYIARFPKYGGRVKVSTNGGLLVTWRRDGREVYYWERAPSRSDGRLMAVSLTYGSAGVSAGMPRPLMRVEPRAGAILLRRNAGRTAVPGQHRFGSSRDHSDHARCQLAGLA